MALDRLAWRNIVRDACLTLAPTTSAGEVAFKLTRDNGS